VNANDPFASEVPGLLQRHFESLRAGSGLSVEIIRERGYRSVLSRKELASLGFTPSQQRSPGLLVPVWAPDGSNPFNCYRPDKPRQTREGKPMKYEFPTGMSMRLDVPPRCRAALADPTIPIWVTEGCKKGDALAMHGLTAVVLLGVWNFKGKNQFGGVTLLADFDLIAWNGRTVNVVFDSDIRTKPPVRKALERMTEHLQRKGATVNPVYLPAGQGGIKVGVDDYLLDHTVAQLQALVSVPRPAPKPAAPMVELLDEAPPALARPLDLVGGRAYAATWLWTKKTTKEAIGKDGEVVRFDSPRVEQRRELLIVRDDGKIYGQGGDDTLAGLGFEVHLEEPPREEKLWRTSGVKAYRRRERPDFAEVFLRLVAVYNRFLDFGRSTADQTTMGEFSACASLTTWFMAAFAVLPYFWPTGDRGSGKTKWGTIWAMTSYLGEVILSSGSFAATRDLANYGGAMLFDDAEILSDPKRSDPNKRELLLAGNRRGAKVPLKEPDPAGGWKTRWAPAYCPRAFTAIRTPDPVLASRTIAIPLVRTGDASKGNADPADTARWPCDHRQLSDDLWATALALLSEAERIWAEFDTETEAVGREFEPWRGILVVARLFERHGVPDLEKKMRQVMAASARERQEILGADRSVLVIRALLKLAGIADISDMSDVADISSREVAISATDVVEKLREMGEEDKELDVEWVTTRAVGRALSRLRVRQERSPNRKRSRTRRISVTDLLALARAYKVAGASGDGMEDDGEPAPPSPDINVRNGLNVQNVRNPEEAPAESPEMEEVPIE
jgi:hypothetical protein